MTSRGYCGAERIVLGDLTQIGTKWANFLRAIPTFTTLLETPAKLNSATVEFERAVTEVHNKASTRCEVVYHPKRLPEELKTLIYESGRLIRVVKVFQRVEDKLVLKRLHWHIRKKLAHINCHWDNKIKEISEASELSHAYFKNLSDE
jgi:hypothetical protein